MKNVALNEVVKGKNFYKLLEKICKDFNIKDSERAIKDFIERK